MTSMKPVRGGSGGASSGRFPQATHLDRTTKTREDAFRYYVGSIAARGIRIAQLLMEGEHRKTDYLREAAKLLDLAEAPKDAEDVEAIWRKSKGAEFVLHDKEVIRDL